MDLINSNTPHEDDNGRPSTGFQSNHKIERRNLFYRIAELVLMGALISGVVMLIMQNASNIEQHRLQAEDSLKHTEQNVESHRVANQKDHDAILKLICDIVKNSTTLQPEAQKICSEVEAELKLRGMP